MLVPLNTVLYTPLILHVRPTPDVCHYQLTLSNLDTSPEFVGFIESFQQNYVCLGRFKQTFPIKSSKGPQIRMAYKLF